MSSQKPTQKLKKGVVRFEEGSGQKKYKALLTSGKVVQFGNKGYQHYEDSVPKSMGGGLYKGERWEHKDKSRRDSYRKRHGSIINKDGRRSIDVEYSPAWFSYYFLW